MCNKKHLLLKKMLTNWWICVCDYETDKPCFGNKMNPREEKVQDAVVSKEGLERTNHLENGASLNSASYFQYISQNSAYLLNDSRVSMWSITCQKQTILYLCLR